MSTSAIAVHFDRENMFVDLADGRRLSVPLTWFPRLLHANPEARERVAISHAGLHWDEIDEDISVEGLLAGRGDQTSKERNIEYAAPKAFISHATEDKAIVVPFATSLRSKGVDAWVDQWEIRPGDSLVQKIFEEGIGGTAAVIVVLSKTSVTKKWVKEELDAAVIGRINQTSRLIPFLIEDCEVPVALRATKWVHLHNDLNSAVDEVVHALHGTSGKPPLGHAPHTLEILSLLFRASHQSIPWFFSQSEKSI